jgi:hypothetical protein
VPLMRARRAGQPEQMAEQPAETILSTEGVRA